MLEEVRNISPLQTDVIERKAYSVDGLDPAAVVSPHSLAEIGEILAAANTAGLAIIPWGQGTQMAFGNPPRRYDIALSLARLDEIVEHDVENLTVTVQAGVRLDKLQARLAEAHQFLPLDPLPSAANLTRGGPPSLGGVNAQSTGSPQDQGGRGADPEATRGATIGGILATNASGAWRLGYGTARDLTLGMRVVLADGTAISLGGKVMKNVAGFDLVKLFIGSLGTLGVIGEATLRTFAEPGVRRTLVVSGMSHPEAAVALAQRFLDLRLEPTALDILSPVEGRYDVLVRLEGAIEAVERQVRDFRATATSSAEVFDGAIQGDLWQLPLAVSCIRVRLSLPIAAMRPGLVAVRDLSAAYGITRALQAHAGSGTVHLFFDPDDRLDRLPGLLKALRLRARELGGRLVLMAAPPALKHVIGVWDVPGPELDVMNSLKFQFDPRSILNPGRFVGGL